MGLKLVGVNGFPNHVGHAIIQIIQCRHGNIIAPCGTRASALRAQKPFVYQGFYSLADGRQTNAQVCGQVCPILYAVGALCVRERIHVLKAIAELPAVVDQPENVPAHQIHAQKNPISARDEYIFRTHVLLRKLLCLYRGGKT